MQLHKLTLFSNKINKIFWLLFQLNSSSWLVGRGPSLAEVFSEVFAFLMNGHSQRVYSEVKSEFKYIFKNIKNCARL